MHIISIFGPTAVGKTSLSILLAKTLGFEIISCDSRQFYKELVIGTAKPSKEELKIVPHHFIEHLSVYQTYNAGSFERDASEKLDEIFSRYNAVFVVGGSCLYGKALLEGLDIFPEVSSEIKNLWISFFQRKGLHFLQDSLKKRDPCYYKTVDLNNPHRMIRALSVIESSGRPFSYFLKKRRRKNIKVIKIGLILPRAELYKRIDQRVDKMIKNGLLEEARIWSNCRHLNALKTIGYKEFFYYLDGHYDFYQAVNEIKKNTSKYAKKQITWLRKDSSILWFSPIEYKEILNFILKALYSLQS